MSATLYYRLESARKPHIPCSAPSRFGELMERRKGQAPWAFDRNDLDWIRGMIDVGSGIDDSLEKLWNLIDAHGGVHVWKEY